VDELLRVHHDIDPLERHVEEQVRLDHFEALVDQRRGIGRDDLAHGEVRMRQRLLRCDLPQPVERHAAERPTARCDDQPAHLASAAGAQTLRDGRVLAVDRHDLPGPSRVLHHRSPDD
jgi:hypothetical protein